jgi:hypothetical protein
VWWRWRRRFNNLFNCYDLDDGNDRYNCDNVHDFDYVDDFDDFDDVHHLNNFDDLNNFDNRHNRFDQRRNLGIASP